MKQISTGFLVILAAGMFLFSGNGVWAKDNLSWDEAVANENRTGARKYLGFSPGAQSWDKVISVLKTANAVYKTTYSYQGYTKVLPVIKVNSYSKFSKFGTVKESYLHFTPDRKLYQIVVTWEDAAETKTFNIIKDALDIKYGQPVTPGGIGNRGFRKEYQYKDNEITILLELNTFGFKPTTSLLYTYTPATQEYVNAKKRIDADIKQKNAKKAGTDL